jgi:hypothetical protein
MKLFRGMDKTDYQDVLRAVGLLLDERGYRNFRLVEHDEGVVVQAMPTVGGRLATHYETFLLGDDKLMELLNRAYQRREPGRAAAPPTASTGD